MDAFTWAQRELERARVLIQKAERRCSIIAQEVNRVLESDQ